MVTSCLTGASAAYNGTRGTISQISVTFDLRAFDDLHRSTPTRPPAQLCGLTQANGRACWTCLLRE